MRRASLGADSDDSASFAYTTPLKTTTACQSQGTDTLLKPIPFYKRFLSVEAALRNKHVLRPWEHTATFSKTTFLNVANDRLRLELIQLYEKLKFEQTSDSRGFMFAWFDIEEKEKKKKKKLIERLWKDYDKADFSAQVILGVNESRIGAGNESRHRRSSTTNGHGSSGHNGGVDDSAHWVQTKLDRRIQAGMLSTVNACIISIQTLKVVEREGGGGRARGGIPGSAVFNRDSTDFTSKRKSYIQEFRNPAIRNSSVVSNLNVINDE